jgi:hypothetical protein
MRSLEFWSEDDFQEFREEMEGIYGDHSYIFRKIIDADETEAEIGDFVILDREYHYEEDVEQVALIVSVLESGDEKCYGCSYINVSFSKYSLSDQPIEITSEDYGGYMTAFKRKVTKEEAIEILKRNSQISYERALEDLAEDKKCVDDVIESIVNDIDRNKSEKYKVERMSIEGFWCRTKIDNSLKDNIGWGKAEEDKDEDI